MTTESGATVEKAELRRLVLGILKDNPQTHLHSIESELRKHADNYGRRDALTLQEVVWEFLVQGVLAPGKNSMNLNLPFVHVTEYGVRCLEDGAILAHDPERYIERLIERAGGTPDEIITESTREGLQAFLAGRYTAAVVMLARAAEHLFDRLITSLIRSGRRAGRGTKTLETCGRAPDRRYRVIRRALSSRHLPSGLDDELEPQLAGLQSLIQLTRTDRGGPRVPTLNRDRVLGLFLLFPDQCRFLYSLTDHLEDLSA
jgi:hypothetical protein